MEVKYWSKSGTADIMKIQIVGGTYLEICQFPQWKEIFGSGLRAAIVIRSLGGEVRFHTYASEDFSFPLLSRAAESEFEVNLTANPYGVRFEYVHGFSTPQIIPPVPFLRESKAGRIEIEGSAILRFGMIEGDAVVHGDRVVYDPQNPHEPEPFESNGSSAKELAIVCNLSEGRLLTGAKEPLEVISSLLSKSPSGVAVLKCGSAGALVASSGEVTSIPAFETETVWPIGSGDVFAAAFAYEWAAKGNNAEESALLASKSTAYYCETKSAQMPEHFPSNFERPALSIGRRERKKVYLAGPFFSIAQIWLVNETRSALLSQGFDVFSPLHDVGRGSAFEVYEPDVAAIRACDIMFALVDGLDAGTIFEIGFAKALDKDVVVLVQNEKPEDLKMLEGSKCIIQRDFVTAIYKTSWMST